MEAGQNKKMNRIILIGNGFDLAHGLKTSYGDFIDWFWEQQINKINQIENHKEEWEEISNFLEDSHYEHKRNDFFIVKYHGTIDFISKEKKNVKPKFTSIEELKESVVYKNKFLEIIEKRRKVLKNWVDVEELYFQILTNCKNRIKDENVYEIYTVEQLNRDFRAIKLQLEEFIKTRNKEISDNENYKKALTEGIVQEIKKAITKDINQGSRILLLNFNFSNTISELYLDEKKKIEKIDTTLIPIHGEVNKPTENPMVVGYGDEVADDSVEIEKLNNNEFLENVKSIKYVETDNYSEFLKFIMATDGKGNDVKYDVLVLGHSCGNSDRTLLKALFENKNCEEINCFYYKKTEKEDDFNATVDNIYRKFEDKTIFRQRICKKDKTDGAFPQFSFEKAGIENPFRLKISKYTTTIEQKRKNIPSKDTENKTQSYITAYNNMIEVRLNKNSEAYQHISDTITSKKNLKAGFHIGKYQVTQKEWKDITKNNPSHFQGKNIPENVDSEGLPVENVSWYDCISFCNKLSEKYDLSKYYNINGEDITTNEDAKGFRLPTGAEWEYAARGGEKSTNCYFAGSNNVKEVAWYYKNSGDNELDENSWNYDTLMKNKGRTHKAGEKNANELGIHDMSGNVWEWCWDKWDGSGGFRVLCGGSWDNYAGNCRVSNFRCFSPYYRDSCTGFRLVLPQ